MKKLLLLIIAFLAVLTLSACEKGYTNIDNDKLIEFLASDDEYQFIDVRTSDEFYELRIPGFLNYNLYGFEDDYSKLDVFDKTIPVVIMCNSGNRSVTAAKIFHDYGFTTIYNLEDGIQGWDGETE